MPGAITVSDSAKELLEAACSFCHDQFKLGDAVLQCPVCEHWHHTACWQENGNRCCILACAGSGTIEGTAPYPAPEAPTGVEPEPVTPQPSEPEPDLRDVLEQITITPVDSSLFGDSAVSVTDSATAEPKETITIQSWELALTEAVRTSRLDDLLEKMGVLGLLRRHVKGEDYFTCLVAILVIALLALGMVLLIFAAAVLSR